MCAFSVTNKVPGVYIDEVLVPGVIAGVGTSTAAIVGPAEKGPMDTPTLVTNPTQFTETFGDHITAPRVYASLAVQGFFLNGGTTLYFVRIGTAEHATLELQDTAGQNTLLVKAKNEGAAANNITITVDDSSIATGVEAARAEANVSATADAVLTLDDVSDFAVGDVVFLELAPDSENGEIVAIDGAAQTITLKATPAVDYATGTVRIADLAAGRTRFRVGDSTGLESGSYITIAQGATSEESVVLSVEETAHFVTLRSGLANGYTMAAADDAVTIDSLEFTLTVTHPDDGAVSFTDLAMDPQHSNYFGSEIDSEYVEVSEFDDPPNPTPPPGNRPVAVAASPLVGGADDNFSAHTGQLYKDGIDTLEKVDAINILCVPDGVRLDSTALQDLQGKMIAHCEKMQDRFAILDPERGAEPSNGIQDQRDALTSDRGYGALYYPWIWISDPDPDVDDTLLVPPSGHIAGVFARTDEQKGVHKAPANEALSGVLDLEQTFNDTEAGLLNEASVNVLRRIPNRGFRIWGARTLATSTQWRYVNVRRLLLYIEESIQEGTRDAVFEPNNLALWQNVKRQVTDFLTRVWRDGALFGATPEEAFRVRVDEELNPPSEVALGKLTIEVLLRPTVPAEFIIFRIIQDPSRAIVEE